MENKPIIVLGPPRSGTSITSRIIQSHIGKDFPFEVNRHAEPEELVAAFRGLLKRNGLDFEDRFYYPNIKLDIEYVHALASFLKKHKNDSCVIKVPHLSIITNWIQLPRFYKTIHINRGESGVAGSLEYHKKMSKEQAQKCSAWYHENQYHVKQPGDHFVMQFYPARNDCEVGLKKSIEYLGMEWDQGIMQKYWDQKQVEYYKK